MWSQNDEEAVILDLLSKGGVQTGQFLDIGAYDGKTFSNTLRLAELGWSGVCVEPSPAAFIGLLNVHRGNPRVTLVNSAVSAVGGWLTFYDANGDAVSTSSPEHVQVWTAGGVKFTPFDLLSVSIGALLERYGLDFTFVNLDVERQNWSLFRQFPWSELTATKIICVEHDECYDDMLFLLAPLGFQLVKRNAENAIFSRIYA